MLGVGALRCRVLIVGRRQASRGTNQGAQLVIVIVIRRSLMGMAVEHRLDGVMVVMSFNMVAMLMESEGEDRHAAHHPQQ